MHLVAASATVGRPLLRALQRHLKHDAPLPVAALESGAEAEAAGAKGSDRPRTDPTGPTGRGGRGYVAAAHSLGAAGARRRATCRRRARGRSAASLFHAARAARWRAAAEVGRATARGRTASGDAPP